MSTQTRMYSLQVRLKHLRNIADILLDKTTDICVNRL